MSPLGVFLLNALGLLWSIGREDCSVWCESYRAAPPSQTVRDIALLTAPGLSAAGLGTALVLILGREATLAVVPYSLVVALALLVAAYRFQQL